ncbi:PLP-dependent aminotransferase family protein [Thauera humireducens]|uniref:aminotransferase-like domain-containing protein n=1 Tax=Thauera humireducens TaxID=1134435 RepID=UPI0031202E28
MPLERREALLRMADEADFILIEDDYESENRTEGEAIPALKSLDRSGRVIYIGSLSKTLAPGVRLGYVVGPAEVIRELRGARRLNLRHPTAYMQRVFALFLSLGHYDALLRRLSHAHQERARALAAALAARLPELRPVPISGGSSCWVEGPAWLDAEALALAAEPHGVLIEPGNVFFSASTPTRNCLRLGFSAIATERIEEGVERLAIALRELAPRG